MSASTSSATATAKAAPAKVEIKRAAPLGRASNHLGIGVVGLPNVGKSTLFNSLCKVQVPAANFPFCTIDPNIARVAVPDERFDHLCAMFKPASKVQAHLEVTDIAGLVRGASRGEGLGNAFLSHIRAVDGIFQVVRVFENEDITHVDGSIDPIRDLETISEELILKDIETIKTRQEDCAKRARAKKDKAIQMEGEFLERLLDFVEVQKKPVRIGDWKAFEIEILNEMFLLTAKPTVYLVNMCEADFLAKKNKWLVKIKQWIDKYSAPYSEPLIPFCGAIEANNVDAALLKASPEDPTVQAAGTLAKIVKTGYAALELIYYFTAGEDEVRCWTIRKGTKAPQAAGVIHTDFERGFICAEVMQFKDLKELETEAKVKAAGKYKQQGKEYEVQDGDIMFFRANTSGGAKKK